jgi:hypothetical protein
MEVSGKLYTSADVLPEKEPTYPLDSRPGGPQSRSGCSEEETNHALPGK